MAEYARRTDSGIEPYTLWELRHDNPGISFPRKPSDELLAEYGVFRVEDGPDAVVAEDEAQDGTEIIEDSGRLVRRRRKRKLTQEERRERRRLRREEREQAVARDLAVTVLPVLIDVVLGDAPEADLRAALAEVRAVHNG
jgi:hypothetical protein